VDTVKIDQSFISVMGKETRLRPSSTAIITLCRVRNLNVTGEGIENQSNSCNCNRSAAIWAGLSVFQAHDRRLFETLLQTAPRLPQPEEKPCSNFPIRFQTA